MQYYIYNNQRPEVRQILSDRFLRIMEENVAKEEAFIYVEDLKTMLALSQTDAHLDTAIAMIYRSAPFNIFLAQLQEVL